MNFLMRVFIVFLLVISIFACDSDSSTSDEGENNPPQKPVLLSPGDGVFESEIDPVLAWSCSDPDDDALVYDIYLGENSEPPMLIENYTETSYQVVELEYSTQYYWMINAKDENSSKLSECWSFYTRSEDNPPEVPFNPIPADNEIDVEVNFELRWFCDDPDGDQVKFDVYFGDTAEPELVASDIQSYRYDVANLEYHQSYFWKVIAKSNDLQTESPIWSFETRYLNYPPETPSSPEPADNAMNISTYTELDWECSDPEGDAIQYDIYLGTNEDPELIYTGQIYSIYEPDPLEGNTLYYWKIVAYDDFNSTESPIWMFTTAEENHPPTEPTMPWPSDGATGESIYGILRWTCSDPDGDTVYYKVFFGTTEQLTNSNIIALGIDDETIELGTLNYDTTYYWKIEANDGEAVTLGAVWNFTTESDME